jgi:asparagine synthase (glutamine-hydrolysing)
MCGICGVLSSEGRKVAPAVRRMMAAMHHRGPDDEGYEEVSPAAGDHGPTLGLGFRRLAILDLTPAGHQPMVHRPTGDCLVFNGEIYNYRALRARLMAEGARFTSTGDTEVLLTALVRWGERALEEIEGMFALAYFHAASSRILLARDPVGIKPLYVATSTDRLVFASEVRALLASGLVARDLDPAGVAGFLMYGAPQDPLTVHRDIRSFPCGTRQWIGVDPRSGRLIHEPPQRFWRFPAVDQTYDHASAASDFRDTLEKVVANHLAADVATGFFLSAGIDSTALATLAARATGRISTYSVGFDSASMPSELEAARETSRLIGSRHTEIMIDASSIRSWWEAWLAAADRPSVDGLNSFIVSGAVKRAGATVAFSGLGADELFGGYSNFRRVRYLSPVLRSLSKLPLGVRRILAQLASVACPPRYRSRLMALAESTGRLADVSIELKQFMPASSVEALGLHPDSLGLRNDFLSDEALSFLPTDHVDSFIVASRVETYLYMGNTLLRDADITSMAHSLELRVPFVARPVLELAGRLPGKLHLSNRGPGKQVLRRALEDVLPIHVVNRAKTGFSLPVHDWMYSQLRDSCEAAVESAAAVPFLDAHEVRRLWTRFLADRDHTYWMKPMLLVALGDYVAKVAAPPASSPEAPLCSST